MPKARILFEEEAGIARGIVITDAEIALGVGNRPAVMPAELMDEVINRSSKPALHLGTR